MEYKNQVQKEILKDNEKNDLVQEETRVLNIAIDAGMGNTKWMARFKDERNIYKGFFESRVGENEYATIGETTYINGTPYVFGQGKLAVELGHQTKDDEMHRLLMIKALYEAYKQTKATNFNVSVACSLDSFKVDRGASVRKTMSSELEMVVKENKDKVHFTIKQLFCFPENLCGMMTASRNEVNLLEDEVISIDIGTRNFQLIKVRKMPDIDGSLSTTFGMDKIYTCIADNMKTVAPDLGVADAIKDYLKHTSSSDGEKYIDDEAENVIKNYLEKNVFSDIDRKLEIIGINRFTKLLFLGGGSSYLKRFLEKHYTKYSRIFVKNTFYANAQGLLAKGEKTWK